MSGQLLIPLSSAFVLTFTATGQLQLPLACRRLLLFGPRPVHRASGFHCTVPLPGALARCSLAMALSAAALRAWVAELDRIERQDCRPLVYVSKCKHVLI